MICRLGESSWQVMRMAFEFVASGANGIRRICGLAFRDRSDDLSFG